MKAAAILARAVRSLRVDPATMEAAGRIALEAEVKDAEAVQKLYREWVNDLVVFIGQPQMQAAAAAPDQAFVAWLRSRLSNPYHVTYRAHDAVRARYGGEAALLFAEVRWPQEVAWAHRMRGHDNDRIVFLAGMWLRAAKRDPAKLFRGMVRLYAEEAAHDAAYAKSDLHLLEVREILDGVADNPHWRPLWLRFSEREFGPMANGMLRQKLTLLVQQVRDSEYRERTARKRGGWAARLRIARPVMMPAVMQVAVDHGLSSDDLVAAELAFIDEIETGRIDVDSQAQPAWRIFARTLPDWEGRCKLPDEAETLARLDAVQSLTPSWTDGLPDDVRALGAGDQRRLMAWFDAIVRDGSRTPPRDAAVDYGMWLLEASARARAD